VNFGKTLRHPCDVALRQVQRRKKDNPMKECCLYRKSTDGFWFLMDRLKKGRSFPAGIRSEISLSDLFDSVPTF